VAERPRCIFLPVPEKTGLRRLVEPLARFPQNLLCDTPLSFSTYILSLDQIGSGLGVIAEKPSRGLPVDCNIYRLYHTNKFYHECRGDHGWY